MTHMSLLMKYLPKIYELKAGISLKHTNITGWIKKLRDPTVQLPIYSD